MLLLNYKIEYFESRNKIKVIVINLYNEVVVFPIWYEYDAINDVYIQELSPHSFKFYTSDNQFLDKLNYDVNKFAKLNPFKEIN